MKIYLRKVLDHDVTHEVSITKDVHADFFDNSSDLEFYKKTEKTRKYKVTVNNATDRRFGGEFKSLLRDLGDISTNDIIVIFKLSNGYSVDLIKQNDSKYETLSNMFSYTQEARHIIIDTDSIEKAPNLLDEKINKFKRNRIIFGAPGTGKSFKLNVEKDQLVQSEEQYERVTFHPDYTYANFVGTYKPVMTNSNIIINQNDKEIIEVLNDKSISAQEKYDKLYDKFKDDNSLTRLSILIGLYDGGDFVAKKADGSDAAKSSVEKNHGKAIKPYVNLINNNANGNISYKYIPGPFMRLFVNAMKNPRTPYLLLIEEINRANVAAVFGDLFQLLDRDNNEESMYPVEASEDIKKFLLKEGIKLESNKIKIPSNLFIWATMNSADQGVFPMDTAFKRRWDFEYIGIDEEEISIKNRIIELNVLNGKQYINWNKLRKAINDCIAINKINEDKQLGPFFISKKILGEEYDKNDKDKTLIKSKVFEEIFKDKVLMYLFEDVFKSRPSKIFEDMYNGIFRYSNICAKLNEVGLKIFKIDNIESVYTTDEGKINEILD